MTVVCKACTAVSSAGWPGPVCPQLALQAGQGQFPLTSVITSSPGRVCLHLGKRGYPCAKYCYIHSNWIHRSDEFSEKSDKNVAKPCIHNLAEHLLRKIPGDWKRISLYSVLQSVTFALSPSLVSHSKIASLRSSSIPLSCFNFLLCTFTI